MGTPHIAQAAASSKEQRESVDWFSGQKHYLPFHTPHLPSPCKQAKKESCLSTQRTINSAQPEHSGSDLVNVRLAAMAAVITRACGWQQRQIHSVAKCSLRSILLHA